MLSFGNQGAAQAQNLRDTGFANSQIIIANRPDSYAEDAKSKGFIVEHDFEKAAKVADGVYSYFQDNFSMSSSELLCSSLLVNPGPGPASRVQ